MKHIKYCLVLILTIFLLFNCGGAKIRVKNQSSFSIRDVEIGNVEFTGEILSGETTEYKDIEEGTYNPTFWAYSEILGIWVGFKAVDDIEIKEGGFLQGDNEYAWSLTDYTKVTGL